MTTPLPKKMDLVVSHITQETSDIKSFRMDFGSHKPFDYLPGQFVIVTGEVWNPKRNRMGRPSRAFSLSSSPTDEGGIEIAVKRYPNGGFSPWLHDSVKPGATLKIKGPQGDFTFSKGETDEIILIAGGIGVAPFRGFIHYILTMRLPTRVKLLYSARTPADFAFAAEFNSLMNDHENFRCIYTITRPGAMPWPGRVGRLSASLLQEHLGHSGALYYLCGPGPMIQEQIQILKKLGVSDASIRFEPW